MISAVSGMSGLRPGCVREQSFDFVRESGLSGYFSKNHIGRDTLPLWGSHIYEFGPQPGQPGHPGLASKIKKMRRPRLLLLPDNPDAATVPPAQRDKIKPLAIIN